jgi:hypothetical protein
VSENLLICRSNIPPDGLRPFPRGAASGASYFALIWRFLWKNGDCENRSPQCRETSDLRGYYTERQESCVRARGRAQPPFQG